MGGESPRSSLPIQTKDASHDALSARSRSPSRDRQPVGTESSRRYRQRSRSPPRRDGRARHEVTHHDADDSRSHRSGRSQTGHDHHRRRHRDQESDRGRGRESRRERHRVRSSNASRQDDDRRDRSPASRAHDYWDDRDMISRSGSRYGGSHHCIDSALKQHPGDAGTMSPAPTPPNAHTVRFPPPETERHYSSHRCHHHSHDQSPTGSAATYSNSGHHRPRRRSSPPRWKSSAPKPVVLPYGARALSRWDFAAFEPLFAHYLEKHKQVRMADMDEESVRERWKAFIAKWNAGELEKSWYEPEMFLRVVRLRALEEARVRAAASVSVPTSNRRDGEPGVVTPPLTGASFASEMMESVVSDMTWYIGLSTVMNDEDPEDEDEYAPPMPPPPPQQPSGESSDNISRAPTTTNNPRPGPTIPSLQDLELRRTLEAEAQEAHLTSLRLLRHADRAEQKARLDDLVPRAEAGTRERQLEKRRLTTEAMRDFASTREPGGEMEIADPELLGGGADDYRRMLANLQQRRTEREVRREEVVRARNAERDERVREARVREEERLEVLREMARQRFG